MKMETLFWLTCMIFLNSAKRLCENTNTLEQKKNKLKKLIP